ncbi:hypothetical protein COT75_00080 [Candidatus Beckwithbacteria bacterium CG10_big_fil_rev_8_21_14_0_10_34_10]|uniref:Glycosyltransferase RgtA/B/C/D-like domain-containing protein n=1 Tax=Candidatus Beckwithbacteria bacterium CG10_big_fil_rev_8_21_14_0_10_34_10 TaxID=1974495 RepID=A0A2H0WAB5_9BACT|nr:MAG: hypothetical protein COT75_00080 [Candidatus Beckwithbacteria bacterium CG10_big_fil_rev_8_21_14_0_10_34_10]
MINKTTRLHLTIIFFISILSSFILSLGFYLFAPKTLETHFPHGSNEVLERNYDGPIYVVLSEALYDQKKLESIGFNKLNPSYYANHFPLLPILIRLGHEITGLNSYLILIIISWFSAGLSACVFYLLVKKRRFSKQPFLLSFLYLFLPPRWLAVRSVGGTEGLFNLLVLLSLYFWYEKKYLLVSFLLILIVLTRPPGIIIFLSFTLISLYQWHKSTDKISFFRKLVKERWSLITAPLALAGLFYFFKIKFGSFWAYFQTGTGTNIHLRLIPFATVLDYNTPMAEGFLFLLAIFSIGIYLLWKQNLKTLAIFSLPYLIFQFFMTVDDIYRYIILIAPFCLIIGYQKLTQYKVFKYFFILFLIGTYIYTFSLLPRRMFHYWDYAVLRLLTN